MVQGWPRAVGPPHGGVCVLMAGCPHVRARQLGPVPLPQPGSRVGRGALGAAPGSGHLPEARLGCRPMGGPRSVGAVAGLYVRWGPSRGGEAQLKESPMDRGGPWLQAPSRAALLGSLTCDFSGMGLPWAVLALSRP